MRTVRRTIVPEDIPLLRLIGRDSPSPEKNILGPLPLRPQSVVRYGTHIRSDAREQQLWEAVYAVMCDKSLHTNPRDNEGESC